MKIALPGVLALGLIVTGCGPVRTLGALRSAEEALAEAEAAGARTAAPYHYFFAEAHLVKAREESLRSAYQDAMSHARVAEEHAERARVASQEPESSP